MATQEDNQITPKTSSNVRGGVGVVRSVDTYAAQCEKCLKWRVITTQEEYEEIRSKIIENPFVCDRKSGVSCEDLADLELNASRTWVIDKPGIPKTPEGFKRSLVLRRDFSKMDAYYITPTGKKLRTRNEIAGFLDANPKYKGVSIDDFNFTSPKVMDETIPEDVKKANAAAAASSNKKVKVLKD
ncbi:methyl-CpG-binding domain-containing protein 4-like [Mercurialis annua]|uniref:methyl-CpG-binding domain-containing protein 4-like n=1 Tax=Mercurialis annua TaxID=3986 RepID=UPI00215E33AD|nr:methyl-CpG-binding domain-containing protein 4-like [Mercurialis annua]